MKMKIRADLLYDVLKAAEAYREEGVLNLTNRGILLRVHEHSNTAIYNAFVPGSAMEEWNPGEHPRLGMDFEHFLNFIPNKKQEITLTVDQDNPSGPKYKLKVQNREYTLPIIGPDTVNGNPEKVPDLDCHCKFKVEWNWISDFIGDLRKILSNKDSGHMYFSPRERGMYLWGYEDHSEVMDFMHWEDLDDVTLEWDEMEQDADGGLNPPEDHGADTIMSIPFIWNIVVPTDKVRVEMDNHYPMKFVSERDEGIKQSWIIPPRFPTEETEYSLPERLIK